MPLTMLQVVQRASLDAAQLVGKPITSVVSCTHGDKGWRLVVEVLERKAVPDSADLLACFEVLLDDDGNVVNFQRLRVRRRGETFDGTEG